MDPGRNEMTGHGKLRKPNENNYLSTSYNYLRSCHRTQCRPGPSKSSCIWDKLETFSNVLMKNPKTVILNYSPLLVYATLIHFSTWLWNANRIICNNHDDQLHGWTKKLQSNDQSQKVMVHYSFLNPGKILTTKMCAQHINDIHQKVHLQLAWPTERGYFFLHSSTWVHITQPILQKLNKLGYEVSYEPPYSSDLSFTNYHFSLLQVSQQLIAGNKLPQPAGYRKYFPNACQIMECNNATSWKSLFWSKRQTFTHTQS